MHNAASGGDVKLVETLTQVSATLDVADADGWTALHFAIVKSYTAIVQALAQAGTKLDVVNRKGSTALY